jgi:hypothetical protein
MHLEVPMFIFFKHLWSAAFDLTDLQRRRTVRIVAGIALALVFSTLLGAWLLARHVVPAESPVWEAVLQTKLALVRLVLAVPLVVIGASLALAIYQVVENSALGTRLLLVNTFADPTPNPETGAKVRNRGTLLAALFVACILGLLIGVLR